MESNPNDLADTTLLSPIVLSLNKINHNGSRRDPNVVNESPGYKQWVPPEPTPKMICRPYGAEDLFHNPRYPDLIPMESNPNDLADKSLFSPFVFSPI